MPEIGTSGSMSGDGKRSVAERPKLPRPSSTLPSRHLVRRREMSGVEVIVLQNLAAFPAKLVRRFLTSFRAADEELQQRICSNARCTLRRTNRRQWRWTTNELGEPPQVLRSCGEQDLVSRRSNLAVEAGPA